MSNSKIHTLYRIYYDNIIVYVGRTNQPLQTRIRGHLFKKPMHRTLDIDQISKIEYTEFESEADMNLYEIYYINLLKPALNCDDKVKDELTVKLPEVEWKEAYFKLWNKWKKEISEKDNEIENCYQRIKDIEEEKTILRGLKRIGQISENEFWNKMDLYNQEQDKIRNQCRKKRGETYF